MKRCYFVHLLISSVSLLCLYGGWPHFTILSIFRSTSSSSSSSSGRNVTILLWYWPFNKALSLQGDVCWDLYRIPRCRLADQRSAFAAADVVVFHHRELKQGSQKLPVNLERPEGQRWAWLTLESPGTSGDLANVFNMTVSYRRDADVTVPYGERIRRREAGDHGARDVGRKREFLVCWVVSNYDDRHKRSAVFRELNASVPVKVFGRWNRKPLSSRALLPTISRCYFYLAFENSVSKDYITEKLWRNAYGGGAVPVVLGPPPGDYHAVAPPRSFIHVEDFASMRELGRHLERLAGDGERYGEYFAWRETWDVKLYTDWRERLCKICKRLDSLPR